MTTFRFRLAKEDQAKYGGDRWYELDWADLDKCEARILEQFEEATNFMVFGELEDLLARGSFRALRACMWLTMRIEGRADGWRDFTGDPRTAEFSRREDEEGEQTDPPEVPSSVGVDSDDPTPTNGSAN